MFEGLCDLVGRKKQRFGGGDGQAFTQSPLHDARRSRRRCVRSGWRPLRVLRPERACLRADSRRWFPDPASARGASASAPEGRVPARANRMRVSISPGAMDCSAASARIASDRSITPSRSKSSFAGRRQQHRRTLRLRALDSQGRSCESSRPRHPRARSARASQLRREDIDDVAADRDFARLLDQRHSLIADADQPRDEQVPVEGKNRRKSDAWLLAGSHGRADAGRARRGTPRRSVLPPRLRCAGPLIESMQDFHTLSDEKRLWGETIEGQRVVAREEVEARAVFTIA